MLRLSRLASASCNIYNFRVKINSFTPLAQRKTSASLSPQPAASPLEEKIIPESRLLAVPLFQPTRIRLETCGLLSHGVGGLGSLLPGVGSGVASLCSTVTSKSGVRQTLNISTCVSNTRATANAPIRKSANVKSRPSCQRSAPKPTAQKTPPRFNATTQLVRDPSRRRLAGLERLTPRSGARVSFSIRPTVLGSALVDPDPHADLKARSAPKNRLSPNS